MQFSDLIGEVSLCRRWWWAQRLLSGQNAEKINSRVGSHRWDVCDISSPRLGDPCGRWIRKSSWTRGLEHSHICSNRTTAFLNSQHLHKVKLVNSLVWSRDNFSTCGKASQAFLDDRYTDRPTIYGIDVSEMLASGLVLTRLELPSDILHSVLPDVLTSFY